MIKYRVSIGEWNIIYYCDVVPIATLDIFSRGIFMVYLKFAGRKFRINMGGREDIFLFHYLAASLDFYRPLTYMFITGYTSIANAAL